MISKKEGCYLVWKERKRGEKKEESLLKRKSLTLLEKKERKRRGKREP